MSDDHDPSLDDISPPDRVVREAIEMIDRAERIMVLTGAGISTDSKIPDFRGPNGVWTKNPGAERQSTLQHYLEDAEARRASWRNRLTSPVWEAEPNTGHRALVRLEEARKLHLLVTQNIDGLHHRAGSDPNRIVEIHGSIRDVVCLACEYRAPMPVVLERVRDGDDDPRCPQCGGILKSATISFGQSLSVGDLRRCDEAASACDLLIAIGTTLSVYPIAGVVPAAKSRGAAVMIINGGPTEMDSLADLVIRGSISEILFAITA